MGRVVGGFDATVLLLCHNPIRVSRDDGIQRWDHRRQILSTVPIHTRYFALQPTELQLEKILLTVFGPEGRKNT